MKLYITFSLLLSIATGVFAQCTGGNVTCPSGHTLTDKGKSSPWTCCNQTMYCGSVIGVSFVREQEEYTYTVGTTTYYCVNGQYYDIYPTPQSCCAS